MRALLWPLIAWSAWIQPATLVAVTKVEGAALASFRLVDLGSASHCGSSTTRVTATLASVRSVGVGSAMHSVGVHDRCRCCSGLCSLGRRGLNQPL
jgi:hypothetical protein